MTKLKPTPSNDDSASARETREDDAFDAEGAVFQAYRASQDPSDSNVPLIPSETLRAATIELGRAAAMRLGERTLEPMTYALAATLPIAAACVLFAIFNAIGKPLADDADVAIALAGRVVKPAIWFGVSVCLVSISLTRIFSGAITRRAYYLGALLTGVTFAVGGTAYVVRDVSHTKGTMKVAVAYTEERLGQSVLASLRQREKTGTFPWLSRRFGPVQIGTVDASRDRGVYVARVEGIPGAMVATISLSGGEITWDNGARQTRRATFLLGTTVGMVGNRLEVRDVQGRLRNVGLGQDMQGPAQGAGVVMALNRSGDTAALIETLALPLK